MNAFRTRLAPLGALAVAVSSATAAPPTASFLAPNKHTVLPGETLNLRFEAGPAQAAQPTAWPTEEVEWLFIRAGGEQENRHEAQPERPADNFLRIRIEHSGVTVLGTNRQAKLQDVTAADLRDFCRQNLAAEPGALKSLPADRKLRIRHIQSAKTFVRTSAGPAEPSATATRRTGQKVELRPLADPTTMLVDSDLPVFAYIEGVKQPGLKVQAAHVPTGTTTSFTTDAEGSGHFHVTAPGLWRVEFHQVQPLSGDTAADWVVYSGTLSFEVKGAGQ